MNIRQLKYFLAVAQTLNFTRAAEKFYISQTAMSQQIKSLEEKLNVQLFKRTNLHVELTPAGRVFVQEAEAIISKVQEAIYRTQLTGAGLTGILKIGLFKGYEHSQFPNFIQNFQAHYPNIAIDFECADTAYLTESLLTRKLDIIFNINFLSSSINQYSQINYQSLETFSLFAALYPSHPLCQRSSVKLFELKDEYFITQTGYEENSTGTNILLHDFVRAGLFPNNIKTPNDLNTILLMVSIGIGITIIPENLIKTISDSINNVIYIPIEDKHNSVELIAAWHKENTNPPLEKIIAELEQKPKEAAILCN